MAATSGSNSTDSVSDGLKKLFPQIAQLKLLPDAAQHMQFITTMEGAVMQYLQQIGGQMAAMGSTQGQPSPGQGPQAGGSGAGPAPAPAAQFAPGGASGGGNVGLAPQVSPDEMQRVLTNVGGNG